MNKPKFATAIPKRRYRLGGYSAVILGEVESNAPERFQFIFALIAAGETAPSYYLTSEFSRRDVRPQGSHTLWEYTDDGKVQLSVSDAWGDLDDFAAQALSVAAERFEIAAAPEAL